MTKISTANTKAEILVEYRNLLSEIKEQRSDNTKLRKELQDSDHLKQRANTTVKDDNVATIDTLRQKLNDALTSIEKGISEEKVKYKDLQQAIEVQKHELENLYEIGVEAESLEAMVENNRRAKIKLEEDIDGKKLALEEKISETKESWQKEEEEYHYHVKINRRNEEDAYKIKKADREKLLSSKELEMADREEEWKRLKSLEASYEEDLEQRSQEAKAEVSAALTQEFDYLKKLNAKELDVQLKLYEQEIDLLKRKIQEQDQFIKTLQVSADAASNQAKDIALKAIENSGLRSLNLHSDVKKIEKE